jgi:hypothetical protein
MPLWRGVDDARLRDLVRAGMQIDKKERTLRTEGLKVTACGT